MELREHAKKVFDRMSDTLDMRFSEAQRLDIINIIEQELCMVVLEARNRSAKAALETDTPHKDLADEISRRIHRANQVLISNLESMR